MKTNLSFSRRLIIISFSIVSLQLPAVFGQGTAFVYQGQLQNNGSPAAGTYNFTFALFSTNTNGVAVAGPLTNNGVLVTNGQFQVLIDFGPGVFIEPTPAGKMPAGPTNNWLEIAVESNGVTTFATLAPRQQITPTPYAIYAENAGGLSGTVSASQLTSIGNTNTDASGNFFLGGAGNSTTTGANNTANGDSALENNTSGGGNTANGVEALYYNTSGSGNLADGEGALTDNTSGSGNTAVGDDALTENISGIYNTAVGDEALYRTSSGSNNIALGVLAGFYLTTGSSNIEIGNEGLATDTNLIRIGTAQTAAYIAGIINGNGAGLTNLSAAQLTSIGNTSGSSGNFFVGPSGNSTMSASDNTAIGYEALFYDTNGNQNAALGYLALYNDTSGYGNTASGSEALAHNTSGNNGTATGYGALFSNSSGYGNTADGAAALYNCTTGSNNIAIGYSAGYSNSPAASSNIDIGNGGSPTDANVIRIGTSQTACYLAGTVYANGVALSSDRDAKENFSAVNAGELLAKVASLPLTEWNYKTDGNDVRHIGPMAQDFQAAFGLDGPDGRHISVVDEGGVALAAIQGLNQKLEETQAENAELKRRLTALEKIVLNQNSK